MKIAAIGLALMLGLAAETGYAAPGGNESVPLGKNVEVEEFGLKFRAFRDALARPLPTLNRINVKGQEQVVAHEWWIHDQHAGSWGNPLAEVSIARITRPFPEKLKTATVDACEKASPEKEKWSDAEIAKWVEKFTLRKIKSTQVQSTRRIDRKIVRYEFENKNGDSPVYGYTVMTTRAPIRCYYLLFFFSPRVNPNKGMRSALNAADSLEFQSAAAAKNERSSEMAATTRNSGAGAAAKRNTTPEYQKSRQQVIDNIRNYPDWWYMETGNFILVSNMRDQRASRQYAQLIEQSRGVYAAYFPLKKPLKAVSTVRLFKLRQEYVNYVGAGMGSFSIGVWMPLKRELAVSPIDFFNRKQKREMMAGTLVHEGFHQYIHFAIDEKPNAPWFNEGMAEFFEGMNKGEVRQLEERPEGMKKLIARNAVDIPALCKKTLPEFYEKDKAADNYLLAGALMYYCWKGAPVTGHPEYMDIPKRFYDAIIETGDWRKATAKAWEPVDMAKFTEDFTQFWSSERNHSRAENFDPTAANR